MNRNIVRSTADPTTVGDGDVQLDLDGSTIEFGQLESPLKHHAFLSPVRPAAVDSAVADLAAEVSADEATRILKKGSNWCSRGFGRTASA